MLSTLSYPSLQTLPSFKKKLESTLQDIDKHFGTTKKGNVDCYHIVRGSSVKKQCQRQAKTLVSY